MRALYQVYLNGETYTEDEVQGTLPKGKIISTDKRLLLLRKYIFRTRTLTGKNTLSFNRCGANYCSGVMAYTKMSCNICTVHVIRVKNVYRPQAHATPPCLTKHSRSPSILPACLLA